MHSYDYSQQSDDYKRIEKAIQYLEANFKSQPTLEKIAESVHLSKYHFDRMFKRWAGISPIQFQQFMTLDYTKQKLADSTDVHPKSDTPIVAITYCILFKISSFHQFFSRDYTHIPMRENYRHANI